MKKALIVSLLLAACTGAPQKDYDAMATCSSSGLKAGTPEYDSCVKQERQARMLKEQREEFDRRKEDEKYWRERRF